MSSRDAITQDRIRRLPSTEKAIIERILSRLELGLASYGAWSFDDGRDYQREAQEEIADALLYVAALMEADSERR